MCCFNAKISYEHDFTLDFDVVVFFVVLVGFVHLPPQLLVVVLAELVVFAEQQADLFPLFLLFLVFVVVFRSMSILLLFFLSMCSISIFILFSTKNFICLEFV